MNGDAIYGNGEDEGGAGAGNQVVGVALGLVLWHSV